MQLWLQWLGSSSVEIISCAISWRNWSSWQWFIAYSVLTLLFAIVSLAIDKLTSGLANFVASHSHSNVCCVMQLTDNNQELLEETLSLKDQLTLVQWLEMIVIVSLDSLVFVR